MREQRTLIWSVAILLLAAVAVVANLDLVMKGMYGLDVLAKLIELDPAVRVLVMSADVQTSSREMVKQAGAAGFINKPAAPEEIVDAVSRIVGGGTTWN